MTSRIYCQVDLTLKKFAGDAGLASEIDVSFSNFNLTSTSTLFPDPAPKPLLVKIPDVSEEHDELLPRANTSRIEIKDELGSFEFNRKFSDLFQYYTPIQQDCTISFEEITDAGVATTSPDVSWSYQVESVDCDLERGIVTLAVKNNTLTDKIITKEVDSTSFTNAPDSSYGRYLPLAIGSGVSVVGTRVDDAKYALTTTFGTTSEIGGVNQYYAKHPNLPEYVEIETTGSTSSYIIDETSSGTSATEINVRYGVCTAIELNGTGYLIDRVTIKFRGTSTPSAVGYLTCEILDAVTASPNPAMTEGDFFVLGSASVNKEDYQTEINATSEFNIEFEFEKPIVVSPTRSGDKHVFIAIRDSDIDYPVKIELSRAASVGYCYRIKGSGVFDGYDFLLTYPPQGYFFRYGIKGMTLSTSTGSTADSNGLGYSSCTIASGASSIDYSSLQIAANVEGLEYSGATTGNPVEVLSLLFDSTEFDDTDIFDTHDALTTGDYQRLIAGATVGKTGRLSLTQEILRNSASNLISLSSTNDPAVALYAWGLPQVIQGRIDDTVLNSFKYSIGNRRTIINNITASFDKNVIETVSRSLIEQGVQSGFTQILSNQTLAGSDSVTLYGTNDLSNANFSFINDSDSMESVLAYYLRRFEHPFKQVEFSLPLGVFIELFPNGLLAGEVIEILTAKMPSFYGSESNPLPVIYNGELVSETAGRDYIKASTYRVQVLSKSIRLVNQISSLYFTGKILDNVNDPT